MPLNKAVVKIGAAALAGALLGSGGYTVYTSEATAYLSDDPRACVNCHIMRDHYDSWQKSSHHAFAGCNTCHVPHELLPKYFSKMRNGYHHSKAFTFQDFHEPIRITPGNARILNENCVKCHGTLVSETGAHLNGGCVRCHTNVGHGPTR